MIFKKYTSYEKSEIYILVDFSNIAYKTHFIYKDNLEFGFALQMINILNKLTFKKGHVIWCLDGYSKDRREIYPDYKMNRTRTIFDKTRLHNLISLWCKSTICFHPELEADDIIAKIVKEKNSIIISGDRDLWALKQHDCQFYDSNKDLKCLINKNHLLNKFNLTEWKHITLYKALFGDTSDNIKASKPFRCPTKFLMPLIQANKSIDDLKDCIDGIKVKYPEWNEIQMLNNIKIIKFMKRNKIVTSLTNIDKEHILNLFYNYGVEDNRIINYFKNNF